MICDVTLRLWKEFFRNILFCSFFLGDEKLVIKPFTVLVFRK